MQKKVNDPNTTPIKQDVVKYKNCVSSVATEFVQLSDRQMMKLRMIIFSRLSRLSITGLRMSSLRNTSRAVEVWARLLKLLTILRSLSLKSTITWLSSM